MWRPLGSNSCLFVFCIFADLKKKKKTVARTFLNKFIIDLPDNLFQIFKIKHTVSFLPSLLALIDLFCTLLTLVRGMVGLVQIKNMLSIEQTSASSHSLSLS